jgi:hypothetical protein
VAAAAAVTAAAAAVALALASLDASALGCWPMREFESLSLGYAACEAEAVAFPFVVRRCADFGATASEAAVRAQLRLEADVRGYREEDGVTERVHYTGRAALAAFDDGAAASGVAPNTPPLLRCNVIDSQATRCGGMLPAAMRDTPGAAAVHSSYGSLCFVLSPLPAVAGAFGTLHCDPPLGSGWQYLARGRKVWHCIDEGAAAPRAFDAAACKLHASPPDMAAVALVARVLTAEISAGDFLSFPVNWAHAVATLEASLGLSGVRGDTACARV